MKKRVLFICYGNACRSIMGEALARHHWNNILEVASAGLTALGYVPEETINVLQEIGVSTRGLYSKGLTEVELDRFDLILDLLEYPLESLMPPSFKGKVIHWYVMDPFAGSLEAFRQTRNTIEWLVTEQLPKWINGE
jgi:arsenate reductase